MIEGSAGHKLLKPCAPHSAPSITSLALPRTHISPQRCFLQCNVTLGAPRDSPTSHVGVGFLQIPETRPYRETAHDPDPARHDVYLGRAPQFLRAPVQPGRLKRALCLELSFSSGTLRRSLLRRFESNNLHYACATLSTRTVRHGNSSQQPVNPHQGAVRRYRVSHTLAD